MREEPDSDRIVRVEGQEVPWRDVLSAWMATAPSGLMLAYLQPPYVGFISTDSDDFNAVSAEAQHRGLVRTSTEALAHLEARLSATVDRRLQSEFSDPQAAGAILASSTLEGVPLSARLTLALLDLAKGDVGRLSSWCRHAQIDFRDVYHSAWHQQASRA